MIFWTNLVNGGGVWNKPTKSDAVGLTLTKEKPFLIKQGFFQQEVTVVIMMIIILFLTTMDVT